ncbi:sporulation protein YunB [Clostridium hydrogenum]|uniref:sporulation protein YunB n=1 Tax=Clostridium hydrogenum TaxID=2855764 RepID=UPI002E3097A7|nr:sporulation protein YunB [Clostridium hydrogenum]
MRNIKAKKFKITILIILTVILLVFNLFIYEFDKIITPTVLAVGDAEMREKSNDIVNKILINEYNNNFNSDDIINVEKDNLGNIVMVKANTLKMNKIACDVSLKSQESIRKIGQIGIKIPAGYIFKNNILAYFGPNITVRMEPVGNVQTSYKSKFEGAGINQTRLLIYVNVKTKIRVIIPTSYNDIEVKNEVPISETIIVGKVPDNALQLNMGKNSN